MANLTFVDNSTPTVNAEWLNDVGNTAYDILGNGIAVPSTKTEALSNLGGVTSAQVATFNQNNTYTAFTTAGTGSAYTLNVVPDAGVYAAGQSFNVTFHTTSVGTPTIAVDAQAPKNLMRLNSFGVKVTVGTQIPSNWRSSVTYDGTDFIVQTMPSAVSYSLRDYLQGGSVTHSGTTLTFQPCQATSGDNTVMMDIATVFTKTGVATAAAWTAGSGGGMLDVGISLAANTNYYIYMINRPDTGLSDYVVSTNSTTPTLTGSLAPYTKFRRLPVILRTNGSGQFLTPITLPPTGQAWVTTYSLAGVSSLDIFWPSTNFGAMQIIGSEIYPGVSGQQLEMQLQNNGTALAGANDYFNSYFYKNASSLLVASAPAVSMLLVGGMSTASADYTACFNLVIGDISKTAKNITAKASSSYVDSSSSASFILENNCGYQGVTSGVSAARTGIRIRASSGSFNQGFITVIGMPK